jgi:hypothetical protein
MEKLILKTRQYPFVLKKKTSFSNRSKKILVFALEKTSRD